MHRAPNSQAVGDGEHIGRRAEFMAPAVVFLICAGGLVCLGRAVLDPGLEWRLLAMVGLAFAMSPFFVEIRTRAGGESIPVPLTHPVLFAGAVAIGPAGAALPAVFCGIARVIFDQRRHKPLHEVLYTILKPSVVCVATSLAYTWTGGSAVRPQGVESGLPLACAGVVYMALSAILFGRIGGATEQPARRGTAAAWSVCLIAGYMLAVLYAVAPTYVLIAPSVAVALAGLALRERPEKAAEVQDVHEQDAPEPVAPQEANAFVDDLTGVANERYLDMFLRRELSRAERGGKAISIAVFDLDDFKGKSKKTNPLAEEALAGVGRELKAAVREYDLVARLAGNRIAVVLPEAGADEALEIAERLHRSLAKLEAGGKSISVSAGLAGFPDHADTPEQLINAAHRALNLGRFTGPNAVHGLHRLKKAS